MGTIAIPAFRKRMDMRVLTISGFAAGWRPRLQWCHDLFALSGKVLLDRLHDFIECFDLLQDNNDASQIAD